ncbi:hypothetical protein ACGFIF_24145 [Kribbella sp. NPDC049174]|uniref:hypothetical protein n=1 Tax=Kribbella sp. NPDC049174 TaxID=3364112 RepID=UPI003716D29B
MTIWTQFLPGVRDARLPLAAGSVWALVGSLLFRYLPDQVEHGELAKSIRTAVAVAPATVVVGVGLFGAYLLGIVLTELSQIVLRLVNGLARLMPVLVGILILLWFLASFLRLLLVAVAALAVLAWHESRKSGGVSYVDLLSFSFTRLCLWCLRFCSDRWQDVKLAWDPSREQIATMVKEESARTLAASDGVRHSLISRIPRGMLWDALRATNLQDAEFQRVQALQVPALASVPLARAVRKIKKVPELEGTIRAALEEKVATHSEARHALISAVVNIARLQADVRNRVDRAHVQLRAQYESVYNEYDRLRSEGEFRTGIALPLTALIAALGYATIDEFDISRENGIWFYVIAGVTGLAMLTAGEGKKSEAAHLLYSSVRQQLVLPTETRTYGIEFFPIKHAGVEIDLEVFRPLIDRARKVRSWFCALPIVRRIHRRFGKHL